MKKAAEWKPSKFVLHGGVLRASRDPQQVGRGSRLIGDLLGAAYQTAIPAHCAGRLLDLGCGKVPFYECYRPYVSENVCVDWQHSLHGVSHVDEVCDLAGSLPFPDDSFDTVLLSDVLEHLYEPKQVLREITRVLRPGGKLLLSVPFLYWLHEQPHDYYRYTEYALKRMLAEAGMDIVEFTTLGGSLEVATDLAAKTACLVPGMDRLFAAPAQACCHWFGRTRLGRRISRRTGRLFPLEYLVVGQVRAE